MPTNRLTRKREGRDVRRRSCSTPPTKRAARMRCSRFATRLEQILRIVRTQASDLSNALEDSSYTPEQRGRVLRAACSRTAIRSLSDVLAVMAERERHSRCCRAYGQSYGEQLERKLNVHVVDVDDRRRARRSSARGHHRRKPKPIWARTSCCASIIDASLIGGIFMSAGGKRIDASVAVAAGKRSQRAQTIYGWR